MTALTTLIKFNFEALPDPTLYICAAGFEERALAVLREAKRQDRGFDSAVAIEYLPFNEENRKDLLATALNKAGIPKERLEWAVFDRFSPESFDQYVPTIRELCRDTQCVCLDISAMSKLLILLLLDTLRGFEGDLIVAYAEADIYHPTYDEFNALKDELTPTMPEFLTSGIYSVVTTPSLSSIAMQSSPVAMVAFPSFNQCLLLAAVNEVSPQELLIIDGKPHERHNWWRQDAVNYINSDIYDTYGVKPIATVSTFDYRETIAALKQIYMEYQYTHRIVVSPICSKLQTVGVFLFKQMHPDVHVVYPTPKGFFKQYTEGIRDIWQIRFPQFRHFVEELHAERQGNLRQLRAKLDELEKCL